MLPEPVPDDPAAEPPKTFMCLPDELNLSGIAAKDGTWYFKVRATDYAGNWSEPAVLAYTRDTMPPLAPLILPQQTDRFGFLESNTFSIDWKQNPDDTDDIAGYSWTLTHVASFEKAPSTRNSGFLSSLYSKYGFNIFPSFSIKGIPSKLFI